MSIVSPDSRLATDQNHQVVAQHDFEPFGVIIGPSMNQPGNTHLYTGHERDTNSGLDYMHFRYYGPNMGRFMKPDNIPGNLTNPQSWNMYSYVHGNPVNFNDPTGHQAASPEDTIPRDPKIHLGIGGSDDSQGHTYNVVVNGRIVEQVHTEYSKSSFNVGPEVMKLLKGVLERTRLFNAEAGGFLFINKTGQLSWRVVDNPAAGGSDDNAKRHFPWATDQATIKTLFQTFGNDGQWKLLVAVHGHRDDGNLKVSPDDRNAIQNTDRIWTAWKWGAPLFYAVVQKEGAIFYREGIEIRMDWDR